MERLIPIGVTAIILGLLLVAAGTLLSSNGSFEGGGVVFVGPIPIIFGSNRSFALLAVLIGFVTFAAFVMFRNI